MLLHPRTCLAAGAAVLVLAGCRSTAGSSGPGGTTPSSAPGSGSATPHSTPSSGGHRRLTAADADNGHSLTAAVGDIVVVVLHSTYWQFTAPAAGAALRATGPASVASRVTGCVPGAGCGTVTESFRAVSSGRAVISASRSSCGEAMRCSPATGTYRLVVIVA